MPIRNRIILLGLLPLIGSYLLFLGWTLFPSSSMVWINAVASLFFLLMATLGVWLLVKNIKTLELTEAKGLKRYRVILGISLFLSLGLAFSYQNLSWFSTRALSSLQSEVQVHVRVDNTSASRVKKISVKLGEQEQVIESIPPYKEEELKFKLSQQSLLKVSLQNNQDTSAEVWLDKDTTKVLVRLDLMQNIVIELSS